MNFSGSEYTSGSWVIHLMDRRYEQELTTWWTKGQTISWGYHRTTGDVVASVYIVRFQPVGHP